MKKAFVCAGMFLGKNQNVIDQAKKLGELLAKNNYTYIQGGYAEGLMGVTLKEFLNHSDNLEFYLPTNYYEQDIPTLVRLFGNNDFKLTKTLDEAGRLILIKKCDVIVVLPGGTGTLEELLYCNETSRANEHTNEIYLVNIDGFYDNYLSQIKLEIEAGMVEPESIKYKIVNSVDELPIFN